MYHNQSRVRVSSARLSGLEAACTFFTSLIVLPLDIQVRTGVLILGYILLCWFPVGAPYVLFVWDPFPS